MNVDSGGDEGAWDICTCVTDKQVVEISWETEEEKREKEEKEEKQLVEIVSRISAIQGVDGESEGTKV